MKDLHILPKVRDGWSYLYAEKCRVDQDEKAIALHTVNGKTPVPCAMLSLLMLGPGTTITHAAVRTLAEHGCLVEWVGEDGAKFYAQGLGETRSSARLLHQAAVWSDPERHLEVVRRMYAFRFDEVLEPALTLRQIRGKEGLRVRAAYAAASRRTGIAWRGRSYRRDNWYRSDGVNRALSSANTCLYGVCHAAIVAAGFSPALGFVHTGKMLSFVYDVADLYKTDIAIPAAFDAAAGAPIGVERRARMACREYLRKTQFLARVVRDVQEVLGIHAGADADEMPVFDTASEPPGGLWGPGAEAAGGGVNWAKDEMDGLVSAEPPFEPDADEMESGDVSVFDAGDDETWS